jgi:heme/copper-type cytochrome/quinol oxidase subunit 2
MTQQIAEIVFWISAAGCAIAELAILRTVFAPNPNAHSSAPIPHSPRGAEMLWAVIPAIALAALLAATWRAIH